MKCIYHGDKEAEFVCSSCGQPICRECIQVINGKNVCKACSYKAPQYNNVPQYNPAVYRRGDGISGFLFFIFLAVPGLRHMYLGLMKRGLHFLTAFFGAIMVGLLLGDGLEDIIAPLLFIVWFYSAFDSHQYRKLIAKGEKVEDKPVFEEYGLGRIFDYFGKSKKAVGVSIIFLGIYLLLKQMLRYGYGFQIPEFALSGLRFILNSTAPILLIAAGIYLLTTVGKRVKAEEE